jgi:hypothetical protein
MEEKNKKKDTVVPSQKAPYEKPRLQHLGTMENLAWAVLPPGKTLGGGDAHSGMGHGSSKK